MSQTRDRRSLPLAFLTFALVIENGIIVNRNL